jgi:hypothetical protein
MVKALVSMSHCSRLRSSRLSWLVASLGLSLLE